MGKQFSDYVVYVDESGDHGLRNVDPNYPVFVLAFCIFQKRHYCDHIVPQLQKMKFKYFGHDQIILHEHDIRKEKSPFNIFKNRTEKNVFFEELSEIINTSNFVLATSVIEKMRLTGRYSEPGNPYHIALVFCLERLYRFLQEKGQTDRVTHILFERRGKREDAELELEFLRVCSGANWRNDKFPFEIRFADKRTNSAGLQLADLVARPVGLHVLKPGQPNKAFDVLKDKFYCEGGRANVGNGFEGWGLKRFP